MSRLSLQLLGPFVAVYGGQPLTRFRTKSVQALLIYLTCQPEPHRRESLMALLWPEVTQTSAQNSLRQALYHLRQAIPQVTSSDGREQVPFLLADRQIFQVNPAASFDLDVESFEEQLNGTQDDWPVAVDLYRGNFLCDFYLPNSAPFEEWVAARRADFKRQILDALDSLANGCYERRDYEWARKYATRQLEVDDLRESALQQLMKALVADNQRNEALAQYEAYQRRLEAEIGAKPTAETQRLAEAIRSGELIDLIKEPRFPVEVQQPSFLKGEDELATAERPVFVARERELARLNGFFEETLVGHGRVVFISGTAGRGKKSLLNEFSIQTQESQPDILVANGNCNAFSGIGDPYLPFREALGMLAGDVENQWAVGTINRDQAFRQWWATPLVVEKILNHGPYLINRFIPGRALLSRMAVAPHDAPWLEELILLAGRDHIDAEGLEHSHLFQQLSNVLHEVSETHPLLLLLEDMQWADNASISLLFHLGRRLEGSRILIVCAYRPEEVALDRDGKPHPLQKVFQEIKLKSGDVSIDLSLVEAGEGRRFVDALLETEPNQLGETFRSDLVAHTGGHALFTVELLRTMQERGDLVQDEAGRWVERAELDWERLPARVEATIELRIDRLEEELRETLSIASVEGEKFTAQVVARVRELSDRKLLMTLSRELEQRHRLVRAGGERQLGSRRLSRYRFVHALFQQYLYNDLSPGERRLLHGEIGNVLEILFEGRTKEIAPQLTRHFLQAGDEARALKYAIEAGDVAFEAYAFPEAETHYRQALTLSPIGAQRAYVLKCLGRALSEQERKQESISTLRSALDHYQSLGTEWYDEVARIYALLIEGSVHADPSDSIPLCEEGLETVVDAPDGPGMAWLLKDAGRAYQFSGFPEKAWSLFQRGLAMTERLGRTDIQSSIMARMGILPGQSRQEGEITLRKAVELAESNSDFVQAGTAHNNLGIFLCDPRCRLDHFRRAAELSRRTADLRGEFTALLNLIEESNLLGNLSESHVFLSAMVRVLNSLSDPPRILRHWFLRSEANILRSRGEWSAAIQQLRVCLNEAQSNQPLQTLLNVNWNLAEGLLESILLASDSKAAIWTEMEAAISEAIELTDRLSGPSETSLVYLRCLLSQFHIWQQQIDLARAALVQAREVYNHQPEPVNQAHLLTAEARLAAGEGRWNDAIRGFGEADALYHELGMCWFEARIRIDWAETYANRGEPGDLDQSRELLQDSLAMFEEMGASGYERVVQARLSAGRNRQQPG